MGYFVSVAHDILARGDSRHPSLPASIRTVQMLLGIRDSKTNKFVLYETAYCCTFNVFYVQYVCKSHMQFIVEFDVNRILIRVILLQ